MVSSGFVPFTASMFCIWTFNTFLRLEGIENLSQQMNNSKDNCILHTYPDFLSVPPSNLVLRVINLDFSVCGETAFQSLGYEGFHFSSGALAIENSMQNRTLHMLMKLMDKT